MLTVRQETFLLRARLMGAAFLIWLGRQDLNLRMPGSKPGALPPGDGPIML